VELAAVQGNKRNSRKQTAAQDKRQDLKGTGSSTRKQEAVQRNKRSSREQAAEHGNRQQYNGTGGSTTEGGRTSHAVVQGNWRQYKGRRQNKESGSSTRELVAVQRKAAEQGIRQ
jgi:hypothetical protein